MPKPVDNGVQSYYNCVLQASAAAIGQATKSTSPFEQLMVDLAKATDSVATPGNKMYLDENTATLKKYGTYDENGNQIADATFQDGEVALNDLTAALAQGKATMVVYPVSIVWTAVAGFVPSGNDALFRADHAAVVTQVDLKRGFVYINDSSMTDDDGNFIGKGIKVPIGVFMTGWATTDYQLIIVAQKDPATGALSAA
jgi:hypothetical protein